MRTLAFRRTHLIGLRVLAHKRLVVGGERRGVVVDVQHPDEDRHAADLSRVAWETRRADKAGKSEFTERRQIRERISDFILFF